MFAMLTRNTAECFWAALPSTIRKPSNEMSADAPHFSDVESMYRAYIDTINTRKADLCGANLKPFVHDQVVHNGRCVHRSKYATLMTDAYSIIPDLHFKLDLLTMVRCHIGDATPAVLMRTVPKDGNCTIGARILFDRVHPTGDLFGVRPGRRKVTFSEHVFYRLREGRIAEVHSLLDWEAFKAA